MTSMVSVCTQSEGFPVIRFSLCLAQWFLHCCLMKLQPLGHRRTYQASQPSLLLDAVDVWFFSSVSILMTKGPSSWETQHCSNSLTWCIIGRLHAPTTTYSSSFCIWVNHSFDYAGPRRSMRRFAKHCTRCSASCLSRFHSACNGHSTCLSRSVTSRGTRSLPSLSVSRSVL